MTQGQQPEALQRAGAVAIRLGREGDRHAAETVRAMSASIAELEAQRDELLAALVKLEASCSEGDIYSREWRHNARLALIDARAVIAKHQPKSGTGPAQAS